MFTKDAVYCSSTESLKNLEPLKQELKKILTTFCAENADYLIKTYKKSFCEDVLFKEDFIEKFLQTLDLDILIKKYVFAGDFKQIKILIAQDIAQQFDSYINDESICYTREMFFQLLPRTLLILLKYWFSVSSDIETVETCISQGNLQSLVLMIGLLSLTLTFEDDYIILRITFFTITFFDIKMETNTMILILLALIFF